MPKGTSRADPKINKDLINDPATKTKPKAASAITQPIETDDRPPSARDPDAYVPSHEEVKALAIAMARGNREPKPEIFVGGMPLWRQWENAAVNALVARHYFKEQPDAE